MIGGVAQFHVDFDLSVGTSKANVFEVTLAELDDFGVGRNQSAEMDGDIGANVLLLQGRQKEKCEVVLGIEIEVVEECQSLVFDKSKVERAVIHIDMGVDGAGSRIFEE